MNNTEITGQSLQGFDGQVTYFKSATRQLPNSRGYAFDEATDRAGVALVRAVSEEINGANISTEEFSKVLARLGPLTNIVQGWKPVPLQPPLTMPVDSVTGAQFPNPYDPDRPDLKAQALLKERDPRLGAYLKQLAEDPWGLLFSQQDEEKRRAQLANLKYSASDHVNNPFRSNDDLAAQDSFIRTQPNWAIEIWKWEAKPVIFQWSSASHATNRTQWGKLKLALDGKPVVIGDGHVIDGSVIVRAAQIDSALAKTQRDAAAHEMARAQEKVNELAASARR